MKTPPFLKAGDKVAIVAPAKRLQSGLDEGIKVLESWGLEVIVGKHVFDEHNLFAGTDEARISDLQQALDDPEIKAVIMARGGYGTTRILDELNFEKLLENPKWVCGFSDITVLLQKLVNNGIPAIHSTVGVLLGQSRHSASDQSLHRALFGGQLTHSFKSRTDNRPGVAEGVVCGGNLSMICNSIGTASEIDTQGGILFIEDVGEYLYHLDRMLIQLKRAGKFDELSGLIIGDFTSMKDHQDSFGLDTTEVISEIIAPFELPVAYGFPGGHDAPNLALYMGLPAKLTVEERSAMLDYKPSQQAS